MLSIDSVDHEGGYVNNPRDPGGETKFGISKRSYPELDIENLTMRRRRAIYRRDFWEVLDGDRINGALMFQVFDMAMNSRPGNAIRCLQEAIGVAPDGHFGPVSFEALQSTPKRFVLAFPRITAGIYDQTKKLAGCFERDGRAGSPQNLRFCAGDKRGLTVQSWKTVFKFGPFAIYQGDAKAGGWSITFELMRLRARVGLEPRALEKISV